MGQSIDEKYIFLQYMNDWIYWINKEMKIFFMSPSCLEVTGYLADEYLQDHSLLARIIHPEDREIYEQHFYEAHKEELFPKEEQVEFRIVTKQGDIRHIHHRCIAIYDNDGNILGRSVSNRDVTKQKQAELQFLSQSKEIEAFYEASLDLLSELNYQKITDYVKKVTAAKYVAFNVYDLNGKTFTTESVSGILDDVKKAINILGFEIVGKKWAYDSSRELLMKDGIVSSFDSLEEFIPDVVIARPVIEMISKLFSIGQCYVAKIIQRGQLLGDFTILMPKGISLHNRQMLEIYCRKLGLILSRLQLEGQLSEKDKILDKFFAQSLDGFFFMMLDEPINWNNSVDKEQLLDYVFEHQRITRVNEAMLKQYGFTEEEFIGLTPNILFAHDLEQGRSVWRQFFDQGQLHIDTVEQKKDGSPMWIEGDYVCIYDSLGRITGHFGIQREITDRKHMERELKQQKLCAEEANKAKTQFLATVSHELRTPMNAIIGMTDIVDEATDTNDRRRYIDIIRKNGEHLLTIINSMLDLSTIEAGKAKCLYREFSLAEFIQMIQDTFRPFANKKGIEFRVTAESSESIIITDQDKLGQIIMNLVGNAIKFTKQGSVDVYFKTYNQNHQRILQCIVKDTGVGIPTDMLEEVFNEFTQVDSSDTRDYGGTGLGLAISKKLACILNGRLTVKSSVGIGSSFTLEIPYTNVAENTGITTTLPNGIIGIKPFMSDKSKYQEIDTNATDVADVERMQGKRILIVEDAYDNQVLIQAYLKKSRYELKTVANGREAVDAYIQAHRNQRPFHLILMDIQMPVMNGYEATAAIRKFEQEHHLNEAPIIALTAYAMEEDFRQSKQAGCNNHLTKPIRKKELLTSIQEYL